MPARLWMVYGSHPCVTVSRALELKGVPYSTVEVPVGAQPLVMKPLFGARTVPGLRFEDGEKVQGSRAILARLEERVPDPPLLPEPGEQRDRVLEAERWGDEVLQQLVRDVLWPTFLEHPGAVPSYSKGGKLPPPAPIVRAAMPLLGRVEQRLNRTDAAKRERQLRALPGHLDKIDGWIADGTLPLGETPNRAELQIGPSLALLATMEDLGDLIDARPCAALARKFPMSGRVPRGALSVPGQEAGAVAS